MLDSSPDTSGRAGHYRQQPTGYRAFLPAPLPPAPPVRVDGSLQTLLSRADRALGRLDGSVQTLPNSDLFVFMYVRKEAVLSSQIEGTQSSLQDLLAAEADLFGDTSRPNDVDEVVNYVRAMKHGLARLNELPVSVRLIREIHERLLEGVRGSHLTPGEPRRSQNWIGLAGCGLADATFVPPPPEDVPEAGLSRNERVNRARFIVANPQGRITQVQRLLAGLAERLSEPHSFRVFQKNSINFGIVTTYRQEWQPDVYQVGNLVGTLPLAPGETRKYTKKKRTKKRAPRKKTSAMPPP